MRKALIQSAGLVLLLSFAAAGGCTLGDEEGSEVGPVNSGGSAGAGGLAITGGTSGNSGGSSNAGEGGGGPMGPAACESFEGLDASCGAMTQEAAYKSINMMLVIDKSGSMSLDFGGGDVPRWQALRDALPQALSNVGDVHFGLIMYPYDAVTPIPLMGCTNCCEVADGEAAVNVPIDAVDTNVDAVIDTINNTEPGGGTPTGAALERALQFYQSPAGMALEGDKYVLLATDGGPNCNENVDPCEAETCTYNMDQQDFTDNACDGTSTSSPQPIEFCLDDANVVAQLDALLAIGVKTFVVGIPGTEQYASYLNTFAVAGGAPQAGDTEYYAVAAEDGAQALADTLVNITTQLVRSCEIQMESAPADITLVNVAVNCMVVPRAMEDGAGGAGSDTASGWIRDADDPTKLVLQGAVCDYVQTMGAERIDVIYGCPNIF